MAAQPAPARAAASAPIFNPYAPPPRNGDDAGGSPPMPPAPTVAGAGEPPPASVPATTVALIPDTWIEVRQLQSLGHFGDDRFDDAVSHQCIYCRRHQSHSPAVHAEQIDHARQEGES